MEFKEINIKDIKLNPFSLIGDEWMLITSGDNQKFNTMTASWGGMGVLWNKNVTFAFVRPQRSTFEFLEKNDYYTLSFFSEKYKKELGYCGRVSGRDVDKVAECKFSACLDEKAPYFKEAKFVIVCKKLYEQFITPESFLDKDLLKNYPNKDYHNMYVGEIVKCLENKENE